MKNMLILLCGAMCGTFISDIIVYRVQLHYLRHENYFYYKIKVQEKVIARAIDQLVTFIIIFFIVGCAVLFGWIE